MYYRVICHNTGIFDAYKHLCTEQEWKGFSRSEAANWLPQPSYYESDFKSYFTSKGLAWFFTHTYPVLLMKIPRKDIHIYSTNLKNNDIIYLDEYQAIIKE